MSYFEEIEQLIIRFKNGDEVAFSELYEKSYKSMFYHAKTVLKNTAATEEDIEDIVAESYIKAYTSLRTIEDPRAGASWLSRTVTNTAIDKLKRLGKEWNAVVDNGEEVLYYIEDENAADAQSMLEAEDLKTFLAGVIDTLPDAQKTAVLLYYYDEKSISEIAAILDCSENTVKSRLSYARKAIEKHVRAEEKRSGTKLYSVTFPAIVLAVRYLIAKESVSKESVLFVGRKIASGCGASMGMAAGGAGTAAAAAAAASAGTAASTGVGAAVSSVIHTVVGALSWRLAGAAAAALIACGSIGGIYAVGSHIAEAEPAAIEETVITEADSETPAVIEDSADSHEHEYGEAVTVRAASCTADGLEKTVCSVCRHTEYQPVKKTAHNFVAAKTLQRNPADPNEMICSVCSTPCTHSYHSGANGTKVCGICGKVQTKEEAHAHNYTSETIDADCTTDGTVTYTCECGDTYSETIPATGHNYEEIDRKETIRADYTAPRHGYIKYRCKDCNEEYTEIIHVQFYGEFDVSDCTKPITTETYCGACGYTETVTISLKIHNYEVVETVAPTEDADGYTLYRCNRCDLHPTYKGDIVPKLSGDDITHEHSYVAWEIVYVTCIQDGYTIYKCSCGDTYEGDFVSKDQRDYVLHSLGYGDSVEPTCTEYGTVERPCMNCGYVQVKYYEPLGHNFQTDPETGESVCTRCGESG